MEISSYRDSDVIEICPIDTPPSGAERKPTQFQSNATEISSHRDESAVIEICPFDTPASGAEKKRKYKYANSVIQIECEDDPDSVVTLDKNSSDYKKKQPVECVKDKQKQIKNLEPEKTMHNKQKEVVEGESATKAFKQFDVVRDHSDHYFSKTSAGRTNTWAKSIQKEWKILEKDLPEMIYVRVYEDRMDLLRAVIVGPAGTPYHDGLFFFDIHFPPIYPQSPPHVHYHAGGLRINPNLYACGKVCLSLLNTWNGRGCELWKPSESTMLQVLVSIQALILNAKPFFNEPGLEIMANTVGGEKQSIIYNEETFLNSCRTMLYSVRRPLDHFKDFVVQHFTNRGPAILVACNAYMQGAQVGCLVGDGVQDVDVGDKSCSEQFKSSLKGLFDQLLKEFRAIGADVEQLCDAKVNDSAMQPSATVRPIQPPATVRPIQPSAATVRPMHPFMHMTPMPPPVFAAISLMTLPFTHVSSVALPSTHIIARPMPPPLLPLQFLPHMTNNTSQGPPVYATPRAPSPQSPWPQGDIFPFFLD
ncbi:hypothetical protein J5N97_004457 [Dioscorea zingiberensis]|uniref:E2 ubiquitin-conjugating enzyme n=1 Tax=Dioscorea zingiberensis TaxID=325984 RepID=A0A9D5HRT0_9LILI|nr:hypothetical protein J5N97_004457 [Dioscorea zingiberensis]